MKYLRLLTQIMQSIVKISLALAFKNIKILVARCISSCSKCTKTRFRPDLNPSPGGEAYDAPPDPLSARDVDTPLPPHTPPPDVFGVSNSDLRRLGSPVWLIEALHGMSACCSACPVVG